MNFFRDSTDVSARCFHAHGLIINHINMLVWTSLKRTVFTSPPNPKAQFFFLPISKVIFYFINFPYETWTSEKNPQGKSIFSFCQWSKDIIIYVWTVGRRESGATAFFLNVHFYLMINN